MDTFRYIAVGGWDYLLGISCVDVIKRDLGGMGDDTSMISSRGNSRLGISAALHAIK